MKHIHKIVLLLLTPLLLMASQPPRVIHTFVALCDNTYQGIVPVPKLIGNGDDPRNNLYWGALYGVKTTFKKSPHWKLLKSEKLSDHVLERLIFKHTTKNVYLVADAYRGREIKGTIIDFLDASAGTYKDTLTISTKGDTTTLPIYGGASLLAYVGHDGLMDFELDSFPEKSDSNNREVVILACFSKHYFSNAIALAQAKPLIWTTGFMAPEAYILEATFKGWVNGEDEQSIHLQAAQAYNKYQKCGLKGAKRLFTTGF